MNKNEALEEIISAHQHRMNDASECIADFLEDEAVISSPTLIQALNVLWGETLDVQGLVDLYTMHTTLKAINPAFAKIYADMWEICDEHSADPEVCADREWHS